MRISTRLALAGFSLGAMSCITQSGAQGSFGAVVNAVVVSHSGNSITLAYTLRVAASGTDSLIGFVVDAPAGAVPQKPGAPVDWLTATRFKARSVVSWSSLARAWGNTQVLPELRMSASGMLGVVSYWAERNAPLESVVSELASDTATMVDTVVDIKGARGSTIGVVPMPADISSGALATRLGSLIDQACALGWIDNHGICNSLKAKAKPQAGPLGALQNELSAQRGKHINESAYLLLSDNVAYLIARL